MKKEEIFKVAHGIYIKVKHIYKDEKFDENDKRINEDAFKLEKFIESRHGEMTTMVYG